MRAGLTLVALAAIGVTGGCADDDAATDTAPATGGSTGVTSMPTESTGSTEPTRTTTTVLVELELLRELVAGGGERTSSLPDDWWAPPPGDGFAPTSTAERDDVIVVAGPADRAWAEQYVEVLAEELDPDPGLSEPDNEQYGFTDGVRTVVVLPITRESGIPSVYAITARRS